MFMSPITTGCYGLFLLRDSPENVRGSISICNLIEILVTCCHVLTPRTGQCPSGFERFSHNSKTLQKLQRNRVYGIGNFTLHLLRVIDWQSVSRHTATRRMGKIHTETHIRLINGGGSVGVRGILADKVTNGDEEVIGIVPKFLIS